MGYRADYLGVHQHEYERIAAGERSGWSTAEEAAQTLAQVQRALALPGVPREGRLLELGCGDGCLSVLLARTGGFQVAGIDIVPLAVELAQKRAAREGVALELAVGNVLALPWPDAHFDVLVDGHCLHCIVLDDRRRFFSEAWRVLKPGGALIIVTMAGDPPPGMPGEFDPLRRCLVHGGVAGRHFGTQDSVLAEARAARFELLAHWLWPAQTEMDCDDLIAALIKPAV
jgi:SAM-dependent methyltransferase